MPAKKKEPVFDPDQRNLEISYTEYLDKRIINSQSQPPQLNQEVQPQLKESYSSQPLPSILVQPATHSQYLNQPQQQTLNYAQSSHSYSEPSSKYEAVPYPDSNIPSNPNGYQEQQRVSIPVEQTTIPSRNQPEVLPTRKVPAILQVRKDILLGGALGLGIVGRVLLNVSSLNYLYWIIVLFVIGTCISLIYFSKNPKTTRPFVVMAGCFLIGFILGGLGR